jgi:hypothetical protein
MMRAFGRSVALVGIFISWPSFSGFAQERICTATEAAAAERNALLGARPDSWSKVYDSYKRFGHCDDGSVGEGFSDAVVRLLAIRWDQLNRLRRLVSSDRRFRRFVLDHIDATTDEDDLKTILVSARTKCPAGAGALCLSIAMRADSARRDMNKTK